MNKYIFIKDETYISDLYNNFIEQLSHNDEIQSNIATSSMSRIKLMLGDEARSLIGNHPMMLTAQHVSDYDSQLSLVSFGGVVYDLPLGKMMVQAITEGSSTLASFEQSNEEGAVLAEAKLYNNEEIKNADPSKLGYIYLSLHRLENTDVFYMILNPTIVGVHGHIEIDGPVNIMQVKGTKDTIKESIFGVEVQPTLVAGHIVSTGLCVMDLLKSSMIKPEDREEFFGQLELGIIHAQENVEATIRGTAICLAHKVDTPLIIEVENEILGGYLCEKEELKWEYIATTLKN